MLKECRNLQYLSIAHCSQLGNDCLPAVLKACPMLKCLVISNTAISLDGIAKHVIGTDAPICEVRMDILLLWKVLTMVKSLGCNGLQWKAVFLYDIPSLVV